MYVDFTNNIHLRYKLFCSLWLFKAGNGIRTRDTCLEDTYVANYTTPAYLANVLNMTKSSISHQLAVLRRSGIVKCRKNGKEVFYTLDDDHIVKLFEIGLEHINHKK